MSVCNLVLFHSVSNAEFWFMIVPVPGHCLPFLIRCICIFVHAREKKNGKLGSITHPFEV